MSDGQWTEATSLASSRIGVISPSDSISSPVTLPICPTRIEREIPAKKPTKDRPRQESGQHAEPERPRAEIHPADTRASIEAAATRSTGASPVGSANTAAMTVMVAASGPTIS